MAEHAKSSSSGSRCRAKGVINYPPFEVLEEPALREVHRFQVRPFGSIQQTCERIPYNSGKKDFFSKTGREGFEAFHYEFKVPGDDAIYRVMWDYNVGLVRMTSFFKCRGYSKTTPAKMLNLNPGLKDITYSITGGSIKAQGYWMPFECAKAICATFCYKISGALIPLFGPDFPFECIPEKAPGHGRMTINPDIVARAKNEAAALFQLPPTLPSPRPSRSVSPLPSRRAARVPERDYHSDYDRRLLLSPYTDTDVDYHPPAPDPYGRGEYAPMPVALMPTSRPAMGTGPGPAGVAAPTPQHSPGWTAVNHSPHAPLPPHSHIPPPHHRRAASHLHEELLSLSVSTTANPWLSALPRSGPSRWPAAGSPLHPRSHHQGYRTSPPGQQRTTSPDWGPVTLPPLRMLKRPFEQVNRARPDSASALPNPNLDNTTNIPPPDDHDPAYDACSSRATSASPSPLKAPPPTPIRQGGTTTPIRQGGPNSNHPSAGANTSPLATTQQGLPPRRRESERNAAITLLHLHQREGSGQGLNQYRGQPTPLYASITGGRSSGQTEGGVEMEVKVERAQEVGGSGEGETVRRASPGVIHVALSPLGGEADGEGEEEEEEEEEGVRAGRGGGVKRRRVLG
ncbi:hypothetical protein C8A05DRAFT_29814 [Staphylotrichum tortipilum]|uniref:HTH APSES-type domain-containing protein n=1 Tax=Staphylotrichum tortipilum TaxID=2831512 RepID=A0AAN6MTS0_9PEZI|nr:hypothetical protein C8A05DRAFT_29814 [Staphylotrichum longicolle]